MLALRAFSSPSEMESFHEPFQNWPASSHPLEWSFEGTIEAIYKSCLRAGDATIDGGACQGRHTKPMAASVGPDGLVIAVDANPAMVTYLQAQFVDSKEVNLVFAALGDGREDLEFSVATEDPGRSSLHLAPAITHFQRVSVPQVRIDDIETQGRQLRFIKLDLEGGEYHALRGAELRLRVDLPVICLEHVPQFMRLSGVNYEEFFELFERVEYDLVDILGSAFNPRIAGWGGWRPNYLVALPRRDSELSEEALAALRNYTTRIYANIYGSAGVPAQVRRER